MKLFLQFSKNRVMRSTFEVLFFLKRNKELSLAPVMVRITVNGTMTQFGAKIEVPVRLWKVKGGRAKGKSVEADRINRAAANCTLITL